MTYELLKTAREQTKSRGIFLNNYATSLTKYTKSTRRAIDTAPTDSLFTFS